jgi:hypothetical protein
LFEHDDPETFEPVCESYLDRDDREVRFTAPPEAFPLFDVGSAPGPATRGPKVGRNDPCPCGSGRKYKKCHLPLEDTGRSALTTSDPRHELDNDLIVRLQEFAEERFGDEWRRYHRDFTDDPHDLQLSRPWSVYTFLVRGKPVVEWYLEDRADRLSSAEREWLEAQRESWLSIWEVTAVDPGQGMTLRDLLTGEVRSVREVAGSKKLVRRDAILARVVDHEDAPLLGGSHHRRLPPLDAADVVRLARKRLRRKRAVPPDRLRDQKIARYLLGAWDRAVQMYDLRFAGLPDLQHADEDSQEDPLSARVFADQLAREEIRLPEGETPRRFFLERYYARWIDEALPALGGKTPRQAARSAAGRAEVDTLLKVMEHHEERFAGDGAFDFSPIRRELRLD